jgi:hypothetical protein
MSHFVYVITVDRPGTISGPVKIGVSSNVHGRLAALQTSCPYPLALVHAFEVPNGEIARDIERAFHVVQKRHRTSGEWFDLNPIVALQLMCACLQAMFDVHVSSDLHADAKEQCGLNSARKKLDTWLAPLSRDRLQ